MSLELGSIITRLSHTPMIPVVEPHPDPVN